MIQQLFRATVVCSPPAKFAGRYRCKRFWAAGETIAEDLTAEDIDQLKRDVVAEEVNAIDRKTNKISLATVKRPFFTVFNIEENGTREVEDPKPVAAPVSAPASSDTSLILLMLQQQTERQVRLEAQNQELAAELAALRRAQTTVEPTSPEPVTTPEPKPAKSR
jgi:hypothetical protein